MSFDGNGNLVNNIYNNHYGPLSYGMDGSMYAGLRPVRPRRRTVNVNADSNTVIVIVAAAAIIYMVTK